MNYRSAGDLECLILEHLLLLPREIDLVVGIPRSGLLAATLIGLHLNVQVCDLEGYVSNRPLQSGTTRRIQGAALDFPANAHHVLLVDDSLSSGASMRSAREHAAAAHSGQKLTTCVAYVLPQSRRLVDVAFEALGLPRVFSWNLLHREFLSKCCVDIDGLLCVDPTDTENDDGVNYQRFLATAPCLVRPSYRIGHLVTSRLEKYRSETVAWLAANSIAFDHLHMLDFPSAELRRSLGVHASFKSGIYRGIRNAELFIESDREQALAIARASGKPALSFGTHELFEPGVSYARLEAETAHLLRRIGRRLRRLVRSSARP